MGEGRLRERLRRLLRPGFEDEPPKDPALVGLLAGSRFEGLPPEEEADLGPAQARRVMEFILDLTEQQFLAGIETHTTETSAIAVAATCGLHPLEITIIGRTVFLQYAPPGRDPHVMMRVARTDDNRDLYRATKIYRLVEDVVRNRLDLSGAERELYDIKRLRSRWPWWAKVAGKAVLVSSITLQANGTPNGALFAMGLHVLANRAGWALTRNGVPGYYATFAQSLLVAGIGIVALDFGLLTFSAFASAVAANLVVLLPVASVVSLAQDAITRYGTTASVRLINVVLVFGALSAGVATAGFIAQDVRIVGGGQDVRFVILPLWLAMLAAAVGSVSNGIAAGGTLRMLPFAALMGMLSITVRTLTRDQLNLPSSLSVLLAAIVLGVVASRLAPALRLPASVLITPAIGASLLPGPDMYRSLSAYTEGTEGAGRQLFTTLVTTVAIGAGLVLGAILGVKKQFRARQSPQEE